MIDAHQHFWTFDRQRHDWISDDMRAIQRDFQPPDLKPHLDAHGFAGCVVVQVDQTEEETRMLLRLAENFDFIRGVVGWIDLRADDLVDHLDRFSAHTKLKGFRHIIQAEKPGFMDQPSLVRGVQTLGTRGYTFDLLVYHHQLEEALRFVARTPETHIVIDHIAKPAIAAGEIVPWEKHMRAMARFPHVYCKVSGMVTEANRDRWKPEDFTPYLDVVADAFGPDRLLYGSDWPVCLVAATYDAQFSIVRRFVERFSETERAMILGGNATKFYHL